MKIENETLITLIKLIIKVLPQNSVVLRRRLYRNYIEMVRWFTEQRFG